MQKIEFPLSWETRKSVRAGDEVLLSGEIYTARDAAHKRLSELLQNGEPLPFEIAGAIIYYAGPTAAPPARVSGAIGPTTSSRMDVYTPQLLRLGLAGMIGKGKRSDEVTRAIVQTSAVYFAAAGGAGALLAERVVCSEIVAFPELGAEAIRRLVVRDFPVTVAIDCQGTSLYETGRRDYLGSLK